MELFFYEKSIQKRKRYTLVGAKFPTQIQRQWKSLKKQMIPIAHSMDTCVHLQHVRTMQGSSVYN